MDIDRLQNELPVSGEQKLSDIKQPHRNDVLCGRGVTTNRHKGNESFRALVGLNKEVYVSSTKKQKMGISRSIVDAVRSLDPSGRFLEKNPVSGLWSDVGQRRAVEKTSQALRDGAASLRKQLSSDLGDPDFLNAVFDMDRSADNDEESNSRGREKSDESKKGNGGDKILTKGKENNKSKVFDKARVFKSRPTVVKKGHRRINSNPGVRSIACAKLAREERGVLPLACPSSTRKTVPLSPCSTPLRQHLPYPSTPQTWSGRVSLSESVYPDDAHHYHSHPESDYYEVRRPQNHSYNYPSTPQRWSEQVVSGDYQPPQCTLLAKYPLSAPSACHSWSREDSWSPSKSYHHLSSVALPPARQQFSLPGYHAHRYPQDWVAQRMMSRSPEHHNSSYHYSSDAHMTHPMTQNEWHRSPSNHAHIPRREIDFPTTRDMRSSSLSVPALGGESSDAMPTRVFLAPRSHRQIEKVQARPRYQPSDFAPPPSSPRLSREAMGSGSESTQSICSQSKRDYLALRFRATQTSPIGEEKKTDDSNPVSMCPLITTEKEIFLPLEFSLKPRRYSSFLQDSEESTENIFTLKVPREKESNTTLCSVPSEIPSDAALDKGIHEAMEDGIMISPIRENSTMVMELPENILTLPISPFGPNDDLTSAAVHID